jgi:hypothetical protein
MQTGSRPLRAAIDIAERRLAGDELGSGAGGESPAPELRKP